MLTLPHLRYLTNLSPRIFCTLLLSFLVIFFYGLYLVFFHSPIDYQQGELVKIMYIHVPSAWLALSIYCFIALCSFISIVWRIKTAYVLALAFAPIGCCFAAITLITGGIWGKPTWGTWWVWDARLTSMLFLFIFYVSYLAVAHAGNNMLKAEKPASVICLIGAINVPIIKFSVNIWNSLHQPASIIRLDGPKVHYSMLKPLLVVFTSFVIYSIIVALLRVKITAYNLKNSNLKTENYDLRSN